MCDGSCFFHLSDKGPVSKRVNEIKGLKVLKVALMVRP